MKETPLVLYKNFLYDSARWEGFRFRPGDIVISTPPKCGTTWTQRICALLVFQTTDLDKPLTSISPWIDMLTRPHADILADLEAQTHRRFIKTHTPFDGIPFDENVMYICVGRDPRDMALSWDGHMANADMGAFFVAREHAVGNEDIADLMAAGPPPIPETEYERFWSFVTDDTPVTMIASTMRAMLHHLSTFWEARNKPNVVMLHYQDLKTDLEGEMRRLAARLCIDVPQDLWPALVKAATFEEMKRNADKLAPEVTQSLWQDNKQFFRRGTSGQWRDLLQAGDEERYQKRLDELASGDLAAWAHHGSRAQ